MEIVVGRGLDDLLFGESEAEVVTRLGTPDKVHLADDGDRRLRYDRLRCGFWFRDDRLHWVRCANPDLMLFGEKLRGRPTAEVLSFLSRHLDEAPETEDYGDWESHSFPTSWLELQFEYDALSEVCAGHLFDDDDRPVWPSTCGSWPRRRLG